MAACSNTARGSDRRRARPADRVTPPAARTSRTTIGASLTDALNHTSATLACRRRCSRWWSSPPCSSSRISSSRDRRGSDPGRPLHRLVHAVRNGRAQGRPWRNQRGGSAPTWSMSPTWSAIPQCSTTRPSSNRQMSITSTSTGAPDGGLPMTDPVLTPRARLRVHTRSPEAATSSTVRELSESPAMERRSDLPDPIDTRVVPALVLHAVGGDELGDDGLVSPSDAGLDQPAHPRDVVLVVHEALLLSRVQLYLDGVIL